MTAQMELGLCGSRRNPFDRLSTLGSSRCHPRSWTSWRSVCFSFCSSRPRTQLHGDWPVSLSRKISLISSKRSCAACALRIKRSWSIASSEYTR